MNTRTKSVFVSLMAVLIVATCSAATAAGAPAGRGEPADGVAHLDRSFRQGRVSVDGYPVHYVIGGTGPALVLLHGWPQTWWEWRLVMPELARDHTVIALDLPGLGDSGRPVGGYDKVTTARRVHDAVHRLGFDRVTMVGHDMGSMVAYRYARDFPGEVDRLVILDTLLFGFGAEDEFIYSWHYLFNGSSPGFAEQIVDGDDVVPFYGYFYDIAAHHPEAVGRQEYYRAYSDPVDRSAGFDYYRAWRVDVADNQADIATHRLSIPLLAMGGQFLYGSRVAQVYRLVADDVREVVAPDSGHWIPEETPRFLVDCLRLFLGDTPPSQQQPQPELAACAP